MKKAHSTKKTLLTACVLVCLSGACKRNEIPSPHQPPGKHEWLLSKVITKRTPTSSAGSIFTFQYNGFNRPRTLTHYEIEAKGDTPTYSYTTFQYNMQKQLVRTYSYDSTRLCERGDCYWRRLHIFNDYRYDASGRILEKEYLIVENLADTSTVSPLITKFSYQDTVITLHRDNGYNRVDTYNQQGNLVKQVYVHAGSTHTYGPYDNAPYVAASANLPIDPFYATLEEPLSKNNPLKIVHKNAYEQIFYTVEYEYLYNKDGLATQRISKGGSTSIENYEYIKAK